jgi:hypothetical protein
LARSIETDRGDVAQEINASHPCRDRETGARITAEKLSGRARLMGAPVRVWSISRLDEKGIAKL